MTEGYVLIQTTAGKVPDVLRAVRALSGVKMAHAVTGPYDIIAYIEASDFNTCGHLIMDRLQKINGVWRTLTCPAVET